jgi:calcineurin-like phosphoesterase family protein
MLAAGFNEHDAWLTSIWNSQVSPGDLVYVVGDFSKAYTPEALSEILAGLNGSIFLVKGNHDQSSVLLNCPNPKIVKWSHRQSLSICGMQTVLSHEPKLVWVGQHLGSFHLHGHTHGRLSFQGRALDVGIDSAYKLLGSHRLFTEAEVFSRLINRSPVSYDGRKVIDARPAPPLAIADSV